MDDERKQLSASISVIVLCRGGKRGYYGGEDAVFVESREKAAEMGVWEARRKAAELMARVDIDGTEVESRAR